MLQDGRRSRNGFGNFGQRATASQQRRAGAPADSDVYRSGQCTACTCADSQTDTLVDCVGWRIYGSRPLSSRCEAGANPPPTPAARRCLIDPPSIPFPSFSGRTLNLSYRYRCELRSMLMATSRPLHVLQQARLVTERCVNPDTQRPYTIAQIERSMKDTHFSIQPGKSEKVQALEVIRQLQAAGVPIERAKMRIRQTPDATAD